MIPILYESTETNFKSNGLGRLSDCISCVVHEERNGVYECEFEYPIIGAHYDEIIKGRIIACVHDEAGDIQPFDIYKRTAPIDGVVTFFAHHISYRQNGIVVKPFTASSCTQAMQGLKTNSTSTNPFTYWTNKSVNASFSLDIPKTLKALLGGVEGSILDVFGTGEYEFDKFTVKLHTHRGDDTGIQIRYGKNLIDLQDDIDCTDCYTGVVPYWINSSGETQELVHLSTWVVDSGKPTYGSRSIIIPMDLTGEFETKPTETQLREKALAKLNDNEPWLPKESITVDFVQLWQTEEYKDYAPLQRVRLCDTVSVLYPELGVVVDSMKIVGVYYDVLLERYSKMTLGEPRTNLAEIINEQARKDIAEASAHLKALMDGQNFALQGEIEEAVTHATDMITGGLGGYVVMNHDENGHPQEILILDDPDINQAVNVIRMNRNGIGFSNDGYDGTYRTAWTIDSHFVADFITTGTLTANLIKAGLLSDVAGKNYWNMETGEFSLQAYSTTSAMNTAISRAVNDYKTEVDALIKGIQDQLDGVVDTYYNPYAPTMTNAPTSDWATSEYPDHEGDMFLDTSTGKSYRFVNENNTWQWKEIPDTASAAALIAAQNAQATADGKRRVFTAQPYTPYDVGDLWVEGSNGDIKVCTYSRQSGDYTASDWDLASKYTDDSSFNAFLDGTYADFVTDTNNTLAKKITTFYTGSTPSGANVGDLWIKTSQQNKLFRYTLLQNNQKGWVEVRDAGIQQALSDAAAAQATADSKIITYAQTDQPTGTTSQPLDIGDLWIDTDDGNRMYRYDGSDWIPYTDISELTTFINGDYADDIASIQTQVDQKIETWYQTTDPSAAWTTADLKQAHKGDLWYNSSTTGTNAGVTKRWTGTAWETQNVPKAVFDEIDGKAAIFYGKPTDTYSGVATGDYLVDSTDGSTYRYNGSVWVKVTDYKTYTDDSVSTAIDTYDDELTQTVIFNKLTNNGETQGIYLQDGKLYINGTYIKTGYLSADRIQGGTFKVGGSNNNYGKILIYNESGVEQGRINSAAVYFKGVGDYADYGASELDYGGFYKFHKNGSELYGLTLEGAVVTPYSSTSYTIGRLVVNSGKIFCIGDTSYGLFFRGGGNVVHCKGYLEVHQQLTCKSGLKVTGTKSREADTTDYGKRLLYCYETPTPMFGDIGEGTIGDDGSCYVWLDPIFSETISTTQYQVFLQLYGEGDCYIAEKNSSYFKVVGTAGLTFGWEIKAKQAGFEQRRLDTWIENVNDNEYADLGENGANYYIELMKGRIA